MRRLNRPKLSGVSALCVRPDAEARRLPVACAGSGSIDKVPFQSACSLAFHRVPKETTMLESLNLDAVWGAILVVAGGASVAVVGMA